MALLIDVDEADRFLVHVRVQVGEAAATAADLRETNFITAVLRVQNVEGRGSEDAGGER